MPIIHFKTQVSLKAHFREIIDRIGVCDSVKIKHPEEFSDFCEVFTRHPDYPDKFLGFIDIKLDYNPDPKCNNQLVVYIIKTDGDIDNVSVMKSCITGKPKDKLKIAMRFAIQPQIDDFKYSQTRYICELCHEAEKIEIDHHSEKMPFAKIFIDFMEINKLPIPVSFDDAMGHVKCFRETDNDFKNSWIEYHKENAILRMLCKSCNRSQPRYKNE
jgi:hypothetical protein